MDQINDFIQVVREHADRLEEFRSEFTEPIPRGDTWYRRCAFAIYRTLTIDKNRTLRLMFLERLFGRTIASTYDMRQSEFASLRRASSTYPDLLKRIVAEIKDGQRYSQSVDCEIPEQTRFDG